MAMPEESDDGIDMSMAGAGCAQDPAQPARGASDRGYFKHVKPGNTRPGSNVRQRREGFVRELARAIRQDGWSRDSIVRVYEPFADRRVYDMEQDAVDELTFEIKDGAHRMAALCMLIRDPLAAQYDDNYRHRVYVVPAVPDRVQQSLEADAENWATEHRTQYARRTFCDELWTLLGVQEAVVDRIIAYSSAMARPGAGGVEGAGSDTADTAVRGARGARGRKRARLNPAPDDLPVETPSFLDLYKKRLEKKLVVERAEGLERREFDPEGDWSLWKAKDLPAWVSRAGTGVPGATAKYLVAQGESYLHCKLRVMEKMLPFFARFEKGGSADSTGGSGLVSVEGKDMRLWDYMCVVNNGLRSFDPDALSYQHLHVPAMNQLGFSVPLAGLTMMMRLVASGRAGGDGRAGSTGRGDGGGGRGRGAKEVTAMVGMVYQQYSAAAAILEGGPTLEGVIGRFLFLDRERLHWVLLDQGEWCRRETLLRLETPGGTVRTHPELGIPWGEMNADQKARERECRALAKNWLADVMRAGAAGDEMVWEDFGRWPSKDGGGRRPEAGPLTSFTKSRFWHMILHKFRDAVRASERAGSGGAAGPAGAETAAATDDADEADEEADGANETAGDGGATGKAVWRQDADSNPAHADAIVASARKRAVSALWASDGAHMWCGRFQDWEETEQGRSLEGEVALVVTDPPYNTRRQAGLGNTTHDQLSSTDMQRAADLIAKLLRGNGQAWVFCSFRQWSAWVSALESAGGGGVMSVSEVPQLVIRAPSAVVSRGAFQYHRLNAAECAVHAYKRVARTGGAAAGVAAEDAGDAFRAYRRCVGWGEGPGAGFTMGSMPAYCNVMDGYVPPKGRELVRMEKGTVRPEQKSVALLRGIIRLFAPGTSDIVVDLFAGTMSAVVAALHEGRRVYACEMDPVCYGAGVGRVYRFQYRRGALGLVSSLERGHCDALGNSNVAAGVATDLVDGEGND